MSVKITNPSILFGGTWVAWGSGRVPVGVDWSDNDFDNVEKTGGEKSQVLSAAIGAVNDNIAALGYITSPPITGRLTATYTLHGSSSSGGGFNHSTPVFRRSDGAEPSTVQPYITCFMWKRTA